jgi:hypothetical protein
VSLEAAFSSRAENGDLVSPWLDTCLEAGLSPMAPDVFNVAPELADGWSLRIEGEVVVRNSPLSALYDGRLETPHDWLEVLELERRCLVLVAALGVNRGVPDCPSWADRRTSWLPVIKVLGFHR